MTVAIGRATSSTFLHPLHVVSDVMAKRANVADSLPIWSLLASGFANIAAKDLKKDRAGSASMFWSLDSRPSAQMHLRMIESHGK